MNDNIQLAVDYINNNYRKEIKLAQLANEAKLSAFHFSRTFKERLGKSPYKYLTEQRIIQAKIYSDLLSNRLATLRKTLVLEVQSVLV